MTAKAKTISGYKWHPAEKKWGFPDTNRTFEKILNAFEGEEIHLDPALKGSENIASPQKVKGIIKIPSPLAGEGQGEGNLDAIRRELLSCFLIYRHSWVSEIRR